MQRFEYRLLEYNGDEIVHNIVVTDEVVFLYQMIERQENIIKQYRKELHITFFDENPKFMH